MDAIDLLTQIIEKAHEHDNNWIIIFIDIKQAFDNEELVKNMKILNIPGKLVIDLLTHIIKKAHEHDMDNNFHRLQAGVW